MKAFVKSKPVLSFFLLTFGFTWLWWGLIYFFRLSMSAGYIPFLIGAAGPSIMAFVVSAILGGKQEVMGLLRRVTLWRVHWFWYIAALFIPAFIVLGGIGLSVLLGSPSPDFSLLAKQWFLIPIALIIGMLLGGPLEEEFGWRGFALVHLQKRYNTLTASVMVGVIWGLWHLPAFLIPWSSQHGLPVVLFLLHDIALAIVFTWIFNNSGGSVGMVILAHAAFNLTITVLPVMPSAAKRGLPLTFAIGLLYLVAIIVLLIFGPKTLTRIQQNKSLVEQ